MYKPSRIEYNNYVETSPNVKKPNVGPKNEEEIF